jgi:hypothetical protein
VLKAGWEAQSTAIRVGLAEYKGRLFAFRQTEVGHCCAILDL